MKADIAVATVSGKAYYLIVNELRRRNAQFLSLTPTDPVPVEVEVVITTPKEKHLIRHDKILVYGDGAEPEELITKALQLARGKDHYEKLVVGVDPGEVLGLAILADGKVIETANSFSVKETVEKIRAIMKDFAGIHVDSTLVRIGDGVPEYEEELLHRLDLTLPCHVKLESVREAGTNCFLGGNKHRRGLRDIASAIRIAGRNGQLFERKGRINETDG